MSDKSPPASPQPPKDCGGWDEVRLDACMDIIRHLRECLKDAMFSNTPVLVSSRCVDCDPAGNTYELIWTETAEKWADAAHVDLNKHDPSAYVR